MVPGKPGILRPNQPIGKHLPRIAVRRNRGLGAVRKDGRQRPVFAQRFGQRLRNLVGDRHRLVDGIYSRRGAAGHGDRVEGIPEDNFLLPLAGGLVADLREERGHAGPTVFRPEVDPRAHQRQSHDRGDALRSLVLDGAVEVDRANAEIAPTRGEQFPGELVVRLILGDRFPHPAVIGLRRVGPNLDGELRLDSQDIAPFHGPVIDMRRLVEETADQGDAFVLVRTLNERFGLFRRTAACRSGPNRRDGQTPRRSRGSV